MTSDTSFSCHYASNYETGVAYAATAPITPSANLYQAMLDRTRRELSAGRPSVLDAGQMGWADGIAERAEYCGG